MADQSGIARALRVILIAASMGLVVVGCEGLEGNDDAPLITTAQVRPHVDRGHCARCHVVAPSVGAPMRAAPPITANQVRPHPDRGDCTACHGVSGL